MFTAHDLKRYRAGTVTANGTTEVTFTQTGINSDSLVLWSLNTAAGTPAALYESSRNVSTGVIGFKSAASNTSVYNIYIIP